MVFVFTVANSSGQRRNVPVPAESKSSALKLIPAYIRAGETVIRLNWIESEDLETVKG